MKRAGKSIGQIIRQVRTARGMTQMELSELVGISYQQIQKYEKDLGRISVERLMQIAEALNLPVTSFLPPQADTVAETSAVYGRLSDEENALLQLFRRVRDKRVKKAVIKFLEQVAAS